MAAGSAKLQTPGSEAGGGGADDDSKAHSWNNKKARDEFEAFKAKLLDQRFDPKHFHDPLLPRNGSDPRNKPKGTQETEGRIDQIIAQYKARS